MTIENDFIPFAVGGSANVLSQAAYAALTSITQNGFTAGIADSAELNKVWRQSSIMAAVVASFIVAQTGQTAIDDGTTATLLANFTAGVVAASKQRVILVDTGSANAYAAANAVPMTALPTVSGIVQTVQIAHTNTATSTYAPDGLAAKPIFGLGASALQGGEMPVGGIATLVSYVGPLLNSGNLCWVLFECIGGAQQVSSGTASAHAAQIQQVVGAVGTVRNLVASLTAAGTTCTWTADEVHVKNSAGVGLVVQNLNLSMNLGTVGLGGVDVSSTLTNASADVYVLVNPTSGAAALVTQVDTTTGSNRLPERYNGSGSFPGYTFSAKISTLQLNSTGQFPIFNQYDRTVHPIRTNVFSNGLTGTNTAFSYAGIVPRDARRVLSSITAATSVSGNTAAITIGGHPTANVGGLFVGHTASTNAGDGAQNDGFVDLISPVLGYWSSTNSGGTPTFTNSTTGWEF